MKDKELDLKIKIIEAFLEDSSLAYNYGYFEDRTGASREEIKKIMDGLRVSGQVEYVKGLMSEDGEVAGSGFELSYGAMQWSIREWLVELKKIQNDTDKGRER